METKAIVVCLEGAQYHGTYYSSDGGTKAIVFYPYIPDNAVQALLQEAAKEYIHNPTRIVHGTRRDGCVYLEVSAAAA